MKIAIAAVLYDDTKRIGSQRARALSKELARLGNEVTVFTAGDPQDMTSSYPGVEVIRLGNYSAELWPRTGPSGLVQRAFAILVVAPTILPLAVLRRRKDAVTQNHIKRLTTQRASSILRLNQLLSTRVWLADARKHMTRVRPMAPYDVVFSTFEPLGRLIRDDQIARTWVADFRDPAVSLAFLPLLRWYLQRYQDRVLSDANWVTTVSNGFKKRLAASKTGQKAETRITVITNGFQERPAAAAPVGVAPLKIVYTGAIYPQQEPELGRLLAVMKSLNDEGLRLELIYAGSNGDTVRRIARAVEAAELVRDLGMVTYERSLELQSEADALLVLSWNYVESGGVLPGKFLEYLGADRPIIVMVAGDVAGSELDGMVRQLRVGISIEEGADECADRELYKWLLVAAQRRNSGLPLDFNPDRIKVDQFNYKNLARKLQSVLSDVVASR